MEQTKKCVVYFDGNLSEQELRQRIEAIHQIKGVVSVQADQPLQAPPAGEHRGIPLESEQNEQSRYAIDQALRWGLSQGRVTASQLANLSAEQIIELAMRFLGEMPEELKQRLGGALSGW